ncbi:hypothetical protein BH10CYA1_BH10CYA1_36000 [soil metagenome]
MPNREVDNIVHNLQGMRSDSDFSQVGRQIRDMQQNDPSHLQRNLQRINESVDMRTLGFPTDFRIAGVNEQNRLVTISEDGRNVEQRNMRDMHVDRTEPNRGQTERMGNREVTTNPVDGSRNYTSRPGDNMWSIARDSLQSQNGERPTNAQINEQVRSIARENHITDPNRLMVGTELRLPNNEAQRPEQQRPGQQPRQESQVTGRPGPYSPNLNAESAELLPRGGASNIVAAPGLAGDTAQDPSVRNRTQGLTSTNENGDRVANYSGQLNNGTIGYTGTTFTSQETRDRSGRLVQSTVTYENDVWSHGAELNLRTPTGNQTIPHVTQVETNFNARTGRYDSRINTYGGQSYVATTDRDGRVVSFREAQSGAN